jgi:hypothetical protein
MIELISKSPILSEMFLKIYIESCVPQFADEHIFQTNYKVISLVTPETFGLLEGLTQRTHFNIILLKGIEASILKNKLDFKIRIIKKHQSILKNSQEFIKENTQTQWALDQAETMSEMELIGFHYFSTISILVYLIQLDQKQGLTLEQISENPVINDLEHSFRFSVDYLKTLSETSLEMDSSDAENKSSKMDYEQFYSFAVDSFADALLFLDREYPSLKTTVQEAQKIFDTFYETIEDENEED